MTPTILTLGAEAGDRMRTAYTFLATASRSRCP